MSSPTSTFPTIPISRDTRNAWSFDPVTGHRLLFIDVPDTKQVKNRLHLDLEPRAGSRDEELDALLGLGATLVADHRGIHGPGSGWITLADPEGNEFCILRSAAERAATAAEATPDH